jgi:prepilin-type N-terminal cleavage/methylation domain-containing protein
MQRISIVGKLNSSKKLSIVDCMLSWSLPRGACGKRGFTLLELLVVCALIGIMLSLSLPSLRTNFFSDPLKTTARKLIGLVSGVRELAVREHQPYLLHINQGEKRIWYEREDKNEKKYAINNREDDKRQRQELRIPEGVTLSAVWLGKEDSLQDQTTLWISKQGYMKQTLLQLEDDDGNTLKVQFFPFLDSALVAD